MIALLISLNVFGNLSATVFNKEFNKREGTSPILFTLATSLITCFFFFAISGFSLDLDKTTVIFGIILSVVGALGAVCYSYAVKLGPLALSGLIKNFSLSIPTLFGIFFLEEPMGRFTIAGLALLVISLILVNYEKSNKKMSLIWLLFILLSFFGNGIFSAFQKYHQVLFNGEKSNELMVVCLGLVALLLLIYYLIFERKSILPSLKVFWAPIGYGSVNVFCNISMMMLATRASASLVYPVISGINMVGLFLISVIFYKETFPARKWVGIILGTASIILLSV